MISIRHVPLPEYTTGRSKRQRKQNRSVTFEQAVDNIGKLCMKLQHSRVAAPKPFKSGSKVNTIKGVKEHPFLHVPAYTFEEDDSYVAAMDCYLIGDEKPFVDELIRQEYIGEVLYEYYPKTYNWGLTQG